MQEANKNSWIQKIGIGEQQHKGNEKSPKAEAQPNDNNSNRDSSKGDDPMTNKKEKMQANKASKQDTINQQISQYKDMVNKSLMQAQDQIHHCEKTRESMIQYELRAKENINEAFRAIDTLADCYEQRISNLTTEYQHDIESIMACYKEEKENFQNIQRQNEIEMDNTIERMQEMQQLYNQEIASRKDNTDTLKEAVDYIKKLEGILRSEQSLRISAESRTKEALREIESREMAFKKEIKERETLHERNRQSMEKTRDMLMNMFDTSIIKSNNNSSVDENDNGDEGDGEFGINKDIFSY